MTDEQKNDLAPIERVEKLIALATDPGASAEEARSAALQAVKDIRENALVMMTANDAQAARKAVEGAQVQVSQARKAARAQQTRNIAMGAGIGVVLAKLIR